MKLLRYIFNLFIIIDWIFLYYICGLGFKISEIFSSDKNILEKV
jgi:hypothetical protein